MPFDHARATRFGAGRFAGAAATATGGSPLAQAIALAGSVVPFAHQTIAAVSTSDRSTGDTRACSDRSDNGSTGGAGAGRASG